MQLEKSRVGIYQCLQQHHIINNVCAADVCTDGTMWASSPTSAVLNVCATKRQNIASVTNRRLRCLHRTAERQQNVAFTADCRVRCLHRTVKRQRNVAFTADCRVRCLHRTAERRQNVAFTAQTTKLMREKECKGEFLNELQKGRGNKSP